MNNFKKTYTDTFNDIHAPDSIKQEVICMNKKLNHNQEFDSSNNIFETNQVEVSNGFNYRRVVALAACVALVGGSAIGFNYFQNPNDTLSVGMSSNEDENSANLDNDITIGTSTTIESIDDVSETSAVTTSVEAITEETNTSEVTTIASETATSKVTTIASQTTAPKETAITEGTTAPKVTTTKETTVPKTTAIAGEVTTPKITTTTKETTAPKVTTAKETTAPKVTTTNETTSAKETTVADENNFAIGSIIDASEQKPEYAVNLNNPDTLPQFLDADLQTLYANAFAIVQQAHIGCPFEYDADDWIYPNEEGELPIYKKYYKITTAGINSIDDVRNYFRQYFTDEYINNNLLGTYCRQSDYIERNGSIYITYEVEAENLYWSNNHFTGRYGTGEVGYIGHYFNLVSQSDDAIYFEPCVYVATEVDNIDVMTAIGFGLDSLNKVYDTGLRFYSTQPTVPYETLNYVGCSMVKTEDGWRIDEMGGF